MCLDTAVLDFVRQLPRNILGAHTPEGAHQLDPAGGGEGGGATRSASVHSGDTVTTEAQGVGVASGTSNSDDIITKLTSYATKVQCTSLSYNVHIHVHVHVHACTSVHVCNASLSYNVHIG